MRDLDLCGEVQNACRRMGIFDNARTDLDALVAQGGYRGDPGQ
ncbi:hypothetical protein [Streptomyces sp900116325]